MRLQKYMALCGVASRRKSEEIIKDGRVKINNKIVIDMGIKVNPKKDVVQVDDRIIREEKNMIYIMLNKPMGYLTTSKDEKGRKTVLDLIEDINERIFPVGRLDADTTGLLLLTNDGDMTYKLTHPSKEVIKRYIAIVEGVPNRMELERFRNGMMLEGRMTAKASVKIAKRYENEAILDISIHEGRNRQIKKMCELINHPVKKLKRIAIGDLEIGGLNVGNWRYLNEEEIESLNKL